MAVKSESDPLAEAIAAGIAYDDGLPPVPIDPMHVSESEFESWLPITVALSRLKPHLGHIHFAREELWASLCSGVLTGAAKIAEWHGRHGEVDERPFNRLFKLLWALNRMPDSSHAFWRTGRIILLSKEASYSQQLPTLCIGVRVDPAGINAILADAGVGFPTEAGVDGSGGTVERSATRRQDLPVLPEPIVQAWFGWLKSSNPNISQMAAEASAKNMFPNHNLSRERIRELVGNTPVGKPRKYQYD